MHTFSGVVLGCAVLVGCQLCGGNVDRALALCRAPMDLVTALSEGLAPGVTPDGAVPALYPDCALDLSYMIMAAGGATSGPFDAPKCEELSFKDCDSSHLTKGMVCTRWVEFDWLSCLCIKRGQCCNAA